MTRVVHAVLFGAVYAITVGTTSAADWLLGAAIGAALPGVIPRGAGWRTIRRLPRFLAGVAAYVLSGVAGTLRVLTGARPWRHVGDVEVPYAGRSPRALAVLAFVATASPGTVAVGFDDRRRVLVLNALDARDPAAIRDRLDRFYAAHQRGVLGGAARGTRRGGRDDA